MVVMHAMQRYDRACMYRNPDSARLCDADTNRARKLSPLLES
jgi:hypothetical protein